MRRRLPLLVVLFLTASGVAQAPSKPAPETAGSPIRVLYIEGKARWDFRYVVVELRRSPGIQLSCCMLDEKRERSVALPASRADFDAYDVILLGDVVLPGDAAQRESWLLELMGFLDRGRGVAFLGGASMPSAYRGTLLEKLLPITLPPREAKREVVEALLLPTATSASHPVLRLDAKKDAKAAFSSLQPLRHPMHVQAVKPDATALLVDAAHPVGDQPAVVVAAGVWTKGRTLFVGTDETWRWRDPGVEQHATFWRNAVRFLANRSQ